MDKKTKKQLAQEELSEHQQQVNIFRFAAYMSKLHPELRLLNGSMNGVRLQIGQAVKAKKAGMKRGFPDIFLPVPRGKYHGLFIELKRKYSGSVSKEQGLWLQNLKEQGYFAYICRGEESAKEILIQYVTQKQDVGIDGTIS